MGTYIYPITQNRDVLARLADVPFSTWEARRPYQRMARSLHYLGSIGDHWDVVELEFECHHLVKDDAPDVYSLDDVLCFGVGKLCTRELARFLDRCGGETRDSVKVAFILDQLGFKLPVGVSPVELEGLYWC